jgi:hypothetical protein
MYFARRGELCHVGAFPDNLGLHAESATALQTRSSFLPQSVALRTVYFAPILFDGYLGISTIDDRIFTDGPHTDAWYGLVPGSAVHNDGLHDRAIRSEHHGDSFSRLLPSYVADV